MTLSKHLQRLQMMDQMIRYKRSGTPEEFARKLGIGTSQLYKLLSELKALGAPIGYCRSRQTYLYLKPVRLNLGFVGA
jgi:predicted DNA-binding transcriptional regulator YafY